ncbi:DUF5666 domain-containing protein [Frateuria soli]|uniref:DUF5666 domain-containing protein n=1 Tax=Frateuria soli TaxID=1542730 RepID=UPI001E5D260D|nr:DUF5666 domain-containing protein [Frateuria soli]UGB37163.1 DUF5666 domain-containing protein [Frateuria soli]
MTAQKRIAASIGLALLFTGAAAAAPLQDGQQQKDTSQADSMQASPAKKPNGTWLSLSGTVTDAQNRFFTLDYGKGKIPVEMDGWTWYGQNYQSLEGDKVTVYGRVDDDLFERDKIEASSVYDQDLGTYFYANASDEEGPANYALWVHPVVVGETIVRGTVTSVNGRDFTVDYGPRKITVDTSQLKNNPLDNKGFQQIDKGDYVSVAGDMERSFWGNRQLQADSVVTLSNG